MKTLLLLLVIFILPSPKISVENSWIRNASGGMNTAVYFDVKNTGNRADTLYKVSSDIAELVQIHETFMKDDMMGMREVKEIIIEPNSTFNFKPKSHHIMLIRLKKDLKEGREENITLHFKYSGEINLMVPVKRMNK